METLIVNTSKYTPKCSECGNIIKFKIDYNTFNVSVECKEGHNNELVPFKSFNDKYIKPSFLYKCICSKCFYKLDDNSVNYKCNICNQLFCQNCINYHDKKTKHNSKVNYIYQYQLCQIHNEKYSFFCETCKINICMKCKDLHEGHNLKNFLDIIPNIKQRDSVNENIKKFKERINQTFSIIDNYKKDIMNRFNKIKDFFDFLNDVNDKLLLHFNYTYYDYYNFVNYNYLLNFIKEEDIYDSSKYINYLIINEEPTNDNNDNIGEIQVEKHLEYINDPDSLKYVKGNLFFAYEDNYFKLFEFKDYSFKKISSYNLDRFDISNIIPAKYSDYIFIIEYYKNKISFLEYNISNQTIELSTEEINDEDDDETFKKIFDFGNGNILTYKYKEIAVWKKILNYYNKHFILNYKMFDVINVNIDLFCVQKYNYDICFYDTESSQCKKIVEYNKGISLLGLINNKYIIFQDTSYNYLIFIDAKYLEIVQITYINLNTRSTNIIFKDNCFFIFKVAKNQLKIIKRVYDLEEAFLGKEKTSSRKTKLNNISKVLETDIGYAIVCDNKNIIFVNLN